MHAHLKEANSSERIYFPELDGLRFLAFLLVFVHHHPYLNKIPSLLFLHTYGWIGVDLFFALSSFLFSKLLIAEFHKTKTISLKKFYMRRIFRIWPIYFLVIGISVVIYILNNGPLDYNIGLRIIGLFTFSENIMTAMYGYNPLPYLSHIWTITFEEQFYIFIPLIILQLIRSNKNFKIILLVAVFIIFNVIRLIFIAKNVPHPAIWVIPVTHFESIILGIVIGFGGFDFLLKKLNPNLIGAIGVLFFAILCFLPNLNHISNLLVISYTLVGLSTSLVLFSVSNSHFLKGIFSKEIFVFMGKRSYGLYVYHIMGNAVGSYLISTSILPSSAFASFIYALSFTIIVSIISYKLIETPFLKLKKKFEVIVTRPI
jgi:peptidoglycan/LPS O-acetylase OafA/YrhL